MIVYGERDRIVITDGDGINCGFVAFRGEWIADKKEVNSGRRLMEGGKNKNILVMKGSHSPAIAKSINIHVLFDCFSRVPVSCITRGAWMVSCELYNI